MAEQCSPYASVCALYLERDIPVIPCIPGEKRPGIYQNGRWIGMPDWTQYCHRMPTEEEVEEWESWPGAGVCLPLGAASGLMALDFDQGGAVLRALEEALPRSPVKKKGLKGYTSFYRFNGEPCRSWDANGERAVDLLSDGRQTVLPRSPHPAGVTYEFITLDTLEDFDISQLPILPDNYATLIDNALAPFQTLEDAERSGPRRVIENEDMGEATRYFREIKDAALDHLDLWVPDLLPGAKRSRDGNYRAVAHWRNCENANVSIHKDGIVDWGGNYTLTALDLVMRAQGWDFDEALDWLKDKLGANAPQAEQPSLRVVSIKDAPVLDPSVVPDAEMGEPPVPPPPSELLHPPGMVGKVADWINDTASKPQPAFAVQGALALGSVLGGRIYRTNQNNYTGLYFLNVGKSASGKEHAKNAIEQILYDAELMHLLGGGGYTSAGAVYTQLMERPAHISCVDEFGKYLQSAKATSHQHKADAITQLMEVFGRLHGTYQPPAYSGMTLSAQNRKAMLQTRIECPSITLLGMTTPGTFYDALSDGAVQDGFLGRFLVVESHIGRQMRQDITCHEVPEEITEWAKAVRMNWTEGNLAGQETPFDVRPRPRVVPISPEARDVFRGFEATLHALMDDLDEDGLDVLLGRAEEIAMRVALVLSLGSGRWDSLTVEGHEAEWAVKYTRYYAMQLVRNARGRISNSEDERKLKEVLTAISQPRKYAKDAQYRMALFSGLMPHGKLCKLMKMKVRDLNQFIDTLVQAGEIEAVSFQHHTSQRAVRCYRLISVGEKNSLL